MRRAAFLGCVLLAYGCSYDWTFRPDAGTTGTQKDGGNPDPNDDSGSGPAPATCTRDKNACAPNQYCRFDDRACGASTVVGSCVDIGAKCSTDPQCACDGTILSSCEAQKSGLDVDESSGSCKGTGSTFACGTTRCVVKGEYCQSKSSGSSFGCVSTTCADCKCLGIDPATGCTCDDATPGELRVDCK